MNSWVEGLVSQFQSLAGSRLERKAWVAFEDAPLEAWPLARTPEGHAVDDAIAQRVLLGEAMLEGFHETGRGDGAVAHRVARAPRATVLRLGWMPESLTGRTVARSLKKATGRRRTFIAAGKASHLQ